MKRWGRRHAAEPTLSRRIELMRRVPILSFLLLLICSGCGQDRVHEGDLAAIYSRVFGELPADNIEVVNGILYEYRWRLGTVTTDDWEMEVVASREWIDRQIESMYLRPVDEDSVLLREIKERSENRYRPWYAPEPLEHYDVYRDITSVGYVHMLVERKAQPDGRHRVFLSKH